MRGFHDGKYKNAAKKQRNNHVHLNFITSRVPRQERLFDMLNFKSQVDVSGAKQEPTIHSGPAIPQPPPFLAAQTADTDA